MRHIEGEGFGKKNRDWNRPELLRQWREQWAESVNQTLAQHGHAARIDARSLTDQRAEILPSETAKSDALLRLPTIHEGGKSEHKKRNAEIRLSNSELAGALAQARAEGRLQPTPPGQSSQALADLTREAEKQAARELVRHYREQAATLAKAVGEQAEHLRTMQEEARRIDTKKAEQARRWTRRQKRMVEAMEGAEEWERKHPLRTAVGWWFSRPLARLQSTATASRLARDGAIARHDQATALGEDLAQGMQRKTDEIQKARREAEEARLQEDEARASLAGLKERHRWENLNPDQREVETRLRAEAREARKYTLQTAGQGRATPTHPQPPQSPRRPRGMGR
jgi:hypothetical protein